MKSAEEWRAELWLKYRDQSAFVINFDEICEAIQSDAHSAGRAKGLRKASEIALAIEDAGYERRGIKEAILAAI